jgi:hypothetical protein
MRRTKIKKDLTEEMLHAKMEHRLHVIYFIDEFSIWLATVVAVLLSDAVRSMAKHKDLTWASLHINSLTVVVASLLSVITYGIMHTKTFKYKDSRKPPYFQRLATALLYGLGWRDLVGIKD